MLEMVLTHRDYRGRGFVRTLVQRFHARAAEQQYDLCFIWGIPFFYRQFGYGYAVDGDVGELLPAWRIPAGAASCYLRKAEVVDIPKLTALYAELVKPLGLYILRDAAYWTYLLQQARHPIELLLGGTDGEVRGYASIVRSPQRVHVLECSLPRMADGMALLQLLKQGGQQEICVAWPQSSNMATLVRGLGSQAARGSQWLWRVPDLPRLINRIAPVLAQRIAASAWRELTEDLIINTYREAYRLRFAQGRLAGADALGFVDTSMGADGGDLCIPPEALVRLILGYRTLDELTDAWPDIIVKRERRNLFETLFPRLSSYLYAPYHYLGSASE